MEDPFDFSTLKTNPDRPAGLVAHRSRFKQRTVHALLGQAFLDTIDPSSSSNETTEAKPDKTEPPITIQMRTYLDTIEWALNKLEDDIRSDSKKARHSADNFPLIINVEGGTLREYLDRIGKELVDQREYEYVMKIAYEMIDRVILIYDTIQAGESLDTIPEPPYQPQLAQYTRRKRK